MFKIFFDVSFGSSVPDLEETVPRSGTHCHAVLGHAQTAHSVVMTGEHTWNRKNRFSIIAFLLISFFRSEENKGSEKHSTRKKWDNTNGKTKISLEKVRLWTKSKQKYKTRLKFVFKPEFKDRQIGELIEINTIKNGKNRPNLGNSIYKNWPDGRKLAKLMKIDKNRRKSMKIDESRRKSTKLY